MLLLFSLMGFGQLRSLRSPSWSIEAAILLDGRSLLLHGVAVVGAVLCSTASISLSARFAASSYRNTSTPLASTWRTFSFSCATASCSAASSSLSIPLRRNARAAAPQGRGRNERTGF